MATFPILSTGAVAQYPLAKGTSFLVDVVPFLDGSDQRCLSRGKALRRWIVQLSSMTELELAAVEEFFDSNQGDFGRFDFVDPFTGETVPNCRVAEPKLVTQYLSVGNGSTTFSIVENHA